MITALIVAAGQGVRMGTAQRKQYLHLGEQPILTYTLKAFDQCPAVDRIVLVVPAEELEFCRKEIVLPAKLRCEPVLAAGGPLRQDSVFNGLQALAEQEGVVLIHDGVRPLVTRRLIEACIQGAQAWQACIPAVPVTDTLKRVNPSDIIEGTVSRKALHMAQTPQAFNISLITEAHRRAQQADCSATDDAALVEKMGVEVHVIPGERANIKITTPEDLQWAEMILSRRNQI